MLQLGQAACPRETLTHLEPRQPPKPTTTTDDSDSDNNGYSDDDDSHCYNDECNDSSLKTGAF